MIRIGFDPKLEAEVEHQQLIRQVALYRMMNENAMDEKPKVSMSYRLLALIGKGMTSMGASLVDRYSDEVNR